MVSQLMVHGRITDHERYLESLASPDQPRGTRLNIAYSPSYSERFILQVVDGYLLNEVPLAAAPQTSEPSIASSEQVATGLAD